MKTTLQILSQYKDKLREQYLKFTRSAEIPEDVQIPVDPKAALALGIQVGRTQGYKAGLLDGVELGFDVGQESVEVMMTQPLVVMPPGEA